tara:strand:+ start:122 stop:907 length:786 start_codon:yes stop_codon:yes gene_type:complete
MKIKKNGKVINLTESDLRRIVTKVIKEQDEQEQEVTEKEGKKNAPITYVTTIGGQKVHFVQPAYELNGKLIAAPAPRVGKFHIRSSGPEDKNALIKWTNSISPKRGEDSFGVAYNKFIELVNKSGVELKNKHQFDKYFTNTVGAGGLRYWKDSFQETVESKKYDVDGWEFLIDKPSIVYNSATQKPAINPSGYPIMKVKDIKITSPNGKVYKWSSAPFYVVSNNLIVKLKNVEDESGKEINLKQYYPDLVNKLVNKIKEGQ